VVDSVTQFLATVALLAVAALVATKSMILGGIIAMLPLKAMGMYVITSGDHAAVKGMLIGTLTITIPVLIAMYWWTK